MEDYLRMAANLPEMDPETTYASMGKPTKPQEYGEEDAGGDMEQVGFPEFLVGDGVPLGVEVGHEYLYGLRLRLCEKRFQLVQRGLFPALRLFGLWRRGLGLCEAYHSPPSGSSKP